MARLIVNILLLSAALSFAGTEATTAQALKPLRVTIPVIGMNFLPLFVAADKGMFAKEGIRGRDYSNLRRWAGRRCPHRRQRPVHDLHAEPPADKL